MKKMMIFSMMCLMAMAAKAQVLTSATVNKVYQSAIKESGDEFAYEAESDADGIITTMYVYQKKNQHDGTIDLKPVCRYQYAYTTDGLLSSRVKSVWRRGDWQQFGRHNYTLTDDSYTVEFSRWNRKTDTFDNPLAKMTYTLLPDETVGSIACYTRHGKNGTLELDWQSAVEMPISMDHYLTHLSR